MERALPRLTIAHGPSRSIPNLNASIMVKALETTEDMLKTVKVDRDGRATGTRCAPGRAEIEILVETVYSFKCLRRSSGWLLWA